MSKFQTLKEEVLKYTLQSYQEQLFAGTSGNLSIYDPDLGAMVITPTSLPYETVTADDIIAVTLDGEILEGTHRPSSEWHMHAEIYKNRSDVRGIVHSHSPYATSFAVSDEVIPVILIEMVPFLGGDIQVARFAIPGTVEVGTNALKVLDGRNACLLQSHGALAVGETLGQAHIRAVYLEDAAKIYHYAKENGKVYTIPEESVQTMLGRKKRV